MSRPAAERPDPPDPVFSVLIAAYNQDRYIRETLRSVEAQTFRDFEVVVVNDGSSDETAARLEEWTEEFRRSHPNRVVIDTIPNSGQSAALEHGFSLCTGRYVCLLDSDDLWLPNKLERVREVASRHPEAGMIVHPLLVIDAQGNRTGDVRPMRAALSEGDLREQVRATARQTAPATTGVVIRRDVFQELLPMPMKEFRSAADAYLTFGASLLAPVRAIHEPLGEYRMHPASNYLRRIGSAEGLRTTVRIQRAIAAHFGLQEAVRRNAYFARHSFALEKLDGTLRGQWSQYRDLALATLGDPSYRGRDKLLFLGFWTVALLSPRPLFSRLWHAFQLRHTGFHRISGTPGPEGSGRTPEARTHAPVQGRG